MIKRVMFSLGALMVALFLLVSCAPATDTETTTEDVTIVNESAGTTIPEEKSGIDEVKTETSATPSQCVDEWICLSSIYKIHRNEDCTLSQKTECKLGCQDGQCRASNTCTPGFKCRNDHVFGYQDGVCGWSHEKECELGCKDNDCVAPPKPEASAASGGGMIENKTSDCTAGWKCADAEYKAYQESDCFIREKLFCAQGCELGQCKA